MKTETVTFVSRKEVQIADADGVPIREGSVLREISDGDRGVVVRVVRAGDRGTALDAVGDLNIYNRPGCTRVTNRYNQWRHIPHNEQTYDERFVSWLQKEHYYDPDYSGVSKDESLAISGIMALLPDNIVSDYGPFPDRLADALRYLEQHLSKVNSPTPTPKGGD